MWVSGILQGLMWRAYTPQGFLAHSFVEVVAARHVEYVVRMAGGLLYLSGVLVMVYNLWRTVRGDVRIREALPTLAPQPALAAAE